MTKYVSASACLLIGVLTGWVCYVSYLEYKAVESITSQFFVVWFFLVTIFAFIVAGAILLEE